MVNLTNEKSSFEEWGVEWHADAMSDFQLFTLRFELDLNTLVNSKSPKPSLNKAFEHSILQMRKQLNDNPLIVNKQVWNDHWQLSRLKDIKNLNFQFLHNQNTVKYFSKSNQAQQSKIWSLKSEQMLLKTYANFKNSKIQDLKKVSFASF